jgi:hypothetical protein
MHQRNDLLEKGAADGLEVFQLTDESLPASHIYMEAQIFTPDSKRLLLHRSAHPHGSDPRDPEHRYLLCDLEAGGKLSPLTTELGATAPSIDPTGRFLYYFVDETQAGVGGRFSLKRVGLDGNGREELAVVDSVLPGASGPFSRPYPLSTISSDGKKLAISGFLGDGSGADAPWGLLVFDIEAGAAELILEGPSWCNVHPQYCRSTDPEASRDILIQENHGNQCDASGQCTLLVGGAGADIHVIADDGSNLRDLPWGRDGNEFCQGHQCWIGDSQRALTSTGKRQPRCAELIEARAVPHVGHLGLNTLGGRRNDLSRHHPQPDFFHFATDAAGSRLITDAGPKDGGGALWLATVPQDETSAVDDWLYLMNPASSWQKNTHIHPFLAPDGKAGFFNSDESGLLQCYMVRGWN